MHPAAMRRMALTMASVSFGMLMAMVLGSSIFWNVKAEQNAPEAYAMPAKDQINIRHLISFEGILDNGVFAMDAAAAVLENTSNKLIENTVVKLWCNGEIYTFEADLIPPNSAVIVPEKEGRVYKTHQFEWLIEETKTSAYSFPDKITVATGKNGALIVSNPGEEKVSELSVYYRNFLPESDLYVGGKAYCVIVRDLEPGQSIWLYPNNFADDYSKLVYWR